MKTSVLFLLTLCLSSTFAAKVDVLAQIRSGSKFGSQLAAEVDSLLKSNTPADEIKAILKDLSDALAIEQATDDEYHKQEVSSCDREESNCDNRVAAAESLVEDAKATQAEKTAEISKANSDLSHNSELQVSNRNFYDRSVNERAAAAKEFAERKSEHLAAFDVIVELRTKLSESVISQGIAAGNYGAGDVTNGGAPAVQSYKDLETALVQSGATVRLRKLAVSMMRARFASIPRTMGASLAAMSALVQQKISPDTLQKLNKMIDDLDAALHKSLEDLETAEESAIQRHKQFLVDLDAELGLLKEDHTRLENLIVVLQNEFKLAQDSEATNEAEIKSASELKERIVAQCTAQAQQFNTDKTRRAQEQETLAKIVELVDAKLGSMKQYLVSDLQ